MGEYKDRHRRISKKCEICGEVFDACVHRIREPSLVQRVCSKECQHKLHSLQMLDDGRKKDKVKMGNGYIGIYMPEHHRATKSGCVLEHIVVWEKEHGKTLPTGWVIHHKNGIKNDNRPENLEGLPRSQHNAHQILLKLQKLIDEQGLKIKTLEKYARMQTWQIKNLNKVIRELSQLKFKED